MRASSVPTWFVVIRAYLDETGQHERDYVLIAGHIGFESQWDRFIPAWRDALGQQRKRLHMHTLRWSSTSTEKLLSRLGHVPAECGLKRPIGGVRVCDYEDLIPGPRAKRVINGYACALLSVAVSLLLCSVPDDERFELILEQQDRYSTHAHIALSSVTQDPNPLLRTKNGESKLAKWSFAPSGSTTLFDQADYLCYALLQKQRDSTSRKARWCAPILESEIETIGRIMTREEIREAVLHEPYPGSNLV